ncbi:hypothetical protein PUNSTDRAFT_142063 [Punctularia strigosozonata HHB-11173 SS5]|uniref:uncharacterized protein n=1 Tax=Punctularia strigosozonata (strain HHB-11173) TaxID=741275 RepID=UPI0004417845|nr:uncharacterized protein PUNSTDRAFT_142063 [Punctularia strigosozonata HHB-11173 SS5]EIN11821.1 hypothetical protein PUNSTDRAFT_142063 [Punctularia strigosozonata HHB-11173 SS5]
MSRKVITFLALALITAVARAQSGAYGQCGGIGWSGATTCVSGYACTVLNTYYSQCLPGAASASPPPVSTTVPTFSPTTVTPNPTTSDPMTSIPATTTSAAAPTGSQLRTDQDPVYHFYLQDLNGVPVLGPEASSGYFDISGGTISLAASSGTLYLNAIESVSTSYKPLVFNSTAITTDWGLEGDTIITTNPRQLNFVACPTSDTTIWSLYLQEGSDEPSSACANYMTLHLPCLC